MGMFTSKAKNNVRFKTNSSIVIQQLGKKHFPSWLYSLQIFYRRLATCNAGGNCLCVDNFGANNFPIPKLIISWTLLKNITTYTWTLKGIITVYWPLTEITTSNMSTFPCQLPSPNPSNFFSALLQKIHSMNPINVQCNNMTKELSIK